MAPVPGHTRRASGTAWALTFLTTLSSVAFAVGAIAGWVLELWPATPVTLLVAAAIVVGGPVVSVLLARGIARALAPARAPARPVRVPSHAVVMHPVAPAPVLTPEQAWGRELLDWRTRPRRRHHR